MNQVIVHSTDPDGRLGLYLWQTLNKGTKWLAHTHGEVCDYHHFHNKDVVFIDCCYEYDELMEIREVANSIKIFAHHEIDSRIIEEFDCYHDSIRSTILIVWEYLNPLKSPPC